MLKYELLSKATEQKILAQKTAFLSDYAFSDDSVIRRNTSRDKASVIRPPFIRDIDKIMHCPYFNRYADKTQVFSFFKNDDITRRGLHVQLVSRIARTIGRALNLNLDLIEAIALGHDIGHTPFGHTGERYLDELYYKHTGRHFAHNIHSVRVLDKIFPYNISLQTLSGIASHDGELELSEYRPQPIDSFEDFDGLIETCYLNKDNIKKLIPSTLEGCVVRISDIIAYLGKDRQDAERAGVLSGDAYDDCAIGTRNAEIINNLMVNIVENSFEKPYIKMDSEHFEALKKAKSDNYTLIYGNKTVNAEMNITVKPMMEELYEKLLSDIMVKDMNSPVYTHHIAYINKAHYMHETPYEEGEPNQIITDYIASMTDDYFVDLYNYLFTDNKHKIEYKGYFNRKDS